MWWEAVYIWSLFDTQQDRVLTNLSSSTVDKSENEGFTVASLFVLIDAFDKKPQHAEIAPV